MAAFFQDAQRAERDMSRVRGASRTPFIILAAGVQVTVVRCDGSLEDRKRSPIQLRGWLDPPALFEQSGEIVQRGCQVRMM